MTRPTSSGSMWQNTGTRSTGRRLSDSAAVADAFLPPARPSHYPPPTLVCLFVWHLFVPRVYLVPSIIGVGPFICPPLLAGGPFFYKWRLKWGQEGKMNYCLSIFMWLLKLWMTLWLSLPSFFHLLELHKPSKIMTWNSAFTSVSVFSPNY